VADGERAIEKLLYLYAERIDAGDFDGIGDLLAHATIVSQDGSPGPKGRQEIARLFEKTTRRYPDDGTPHTQHVITNVIVEVDEASGSAVARSRFTVLQALPDWPLRTIIAGRYRDRFERVDGVWRFCERCMMPEHFGDLSRHLLIELKPS
jgi:3-phenylpropionate/cinnamic acid dioxygenase small subunit